MTAEQIGVIKSYQRDYFIRFGEKLEVNFGDMNGTEVKIRLVNTSKLFDREEAITELDRICFRCKTSPDRIRGLKRIYRSKNNREYTAMIEYIKWIKDKNYSYSGACKLINRDRTTLLHHSKQL